MWMQQSKGEKKEDKENESSHTAQVPEYCFTSQDGATITVMMARMLCMCVSVGQMH